MSNITAKPSSLELAGQEKSIIDARLEKYHQNPESGSSWEGVYKRIVNLPECLTTFFAS
jgi:putative addiction module component (TIGR02574 family)